MSECVCANNASASGFALAFPWQLAKKANHCSWWWDWRSKVCGGGFSRGAHQTRKQRKAGPALIFQATSHQKPFSLISYHPERQPRILLVADIKRNWPLPGSPVFGSLFLVCSCLGMTLPGSGTPLNSGQTRFDGPL